MATPENCFAELAKKVKLSGLLGLTFCLLLITSFKKPESGSFVNFEFRLLLSPLS